MAVVIILDAVKKMMEATTLLERVAADMTEEQLKEAIDFLSSFEQTAKELHAKVKPKKD